MTRAALVSLAALFLSSVSASAGDWRPAQPGWVYHYPRDETSHPDFKTEWWYLTGNLTEPDTGRRFGYQLTFFRQGLRPPGNRPSATSRFVVDHFWFAHLALTDIAGKTFHHAERLSRGAFGESGSLDAERIVWVDDWTLNGSGESAPGHYAIEAAAEDFGIALQLDTAKPMVLHGDNGFSPKSADPGHASHYYSFTRLETAGTLRLGQREFTVEGLSWFDREWSSSLLGRQQVGWDWFAIHLDDGRELMLFQLRRPDGSADFESGSLIAADGTVRTLAGEDIHLTPVKTWKSDRTAADYPVQWTVEVVPLELQLTVNAAIPQQELRLAALSYWEGATIVHGRQNGVPVRGRGYLELTGYGYGSGLPGLRATSAAP